MEYLFKATDGNKATHGGNYLYRKGRWTRHEDPVLCESGWHLAEGKQVLEWLAPTLWLAEIHPDAQVVRGDDKLVASKIRVVERLDTWNDRTARLFAADCAEEALALVENPDPRSVAAIRAARKFADGEIGPVGLAAARDAARDAAGDAAWAAAWDAAWAAARDAAWAAALAAAWAAAGDAAWAAAGDAAGAAARDEQYVRLLGYLDFDNA